jgi:uncharacterized SAM-binding protein YcdF (DUF218 family)
MSTQIKSSQSARVWRFGRVILLLAVAWTLLAWASARALIVKADPLNADALVVLAGSSTYLERTHRAAQLFNEGRAPKIALTNDNQPGGWSNADQRNPLFVERAAEELKRQGVPAEKIEIVPGVVSSTYDEMIRIREYATEHQWKSILIVTSSYHSRRAHWTMEKIFRGSDLATGLDWAAPGEQSPQPSTWWMHALGWRIVPLEYVKLIYYWLRY